ncbi:MAG TPA: hypothetical protein VGJ04_08485 [Pirellulales bacterium]
MCDYSLHSVASRDGRVGDKLISTAFPGALTRGFAAVGEPGVAVCLSPGTEIAFDRDAEKKPVVAFFGKRKLGQKVARFRKINEGHNAKHHDALEFADGYVVLLADLVEGQHATIFQLPVSSHKPISSEVGKREVSPEVI